MHDKKNRKKLNALEKIRQRMTEIILQSSFLPKLTGKGKEYCSMGHELEIMLAKKFASEVNNQDVPFIDGLHGLYAPGLVQRKHGCEYAKGTIDFIGIATMADELDKQVIGLEMKSRVSLHTMQEEKQNRSYDNPSSSQSLCDKSKYIMVKWDDAYQYIRRKHEALQILHHAYIFDLTFVILIVGDEIGEILRGICVQFDDEIKNAYKIVLHNIYMFSLRTFYEEEKIWSVCNNYCDDMTENIQENERTKSRVERNQIVLENALSVTRIDRVSFQQSLLMWRHITQEMTLPIPASARIIPLLFSKWNAIKGVSDTVTKLLDSIGLIIPKTYLFSGNLVTGRYLQLICLVAFRLHQITKSNDLDNYGSLKNFRKAASMRTTFPSFIKDFAGTLLILGTEDEINPKNKIPKTMQIAKIPRTRRSEKFERIYVGSPTTGGTPSKRKKTKTVIESPTKRAKPEEEIVRQRAHECTMQMVFVVEDPRTDNDKY